MIPRPPTLPQPDNSPRAPPGGNDERKSSRKVVRCHGRHLRTLFGPPTVRRPGAPGTPTTSCWGSHPLIHGPPPPDYSYTNSNSVNYGPRAGSDWATGPASPACRQQPAGPDLGALPQAFPAFTERTLYMKKVLGPSPAPGPESDTVLRPPRIRTRPASTAG